MAANIFTTSNAASEDYLHNVQLESSTFSENIDRIHRLERNFFSGLACCDSSTYSLHALIDHYEEEHIALSDPRGCTIYPAKTNMTPLPTAPRQHQKPAPVIAYPQPVPYSRPTSPFIDAMRASHFQGYGYGYGYDAGIYVPDAELSILGSTSPVFPKDFPDFGYFEGTPPPSSPAPSSPPYSSPSSPEPSSASSSFPPTASSSAISSPVCPSAPVLPEVDMPVALASLMGNANIDVFPHDEDGYVPSIMRKDRVAAKAQSRSERGVGKESTVGAGKGGKGKGKGALSADKAAAKAANKQRREKAYKCPHAGCTKSYLNPNGLKYHLEKGTCCFDPVDPEPMLPSATLSAPASLVSSPSSAPLTLPATQPAPVHAYPYPLAAPAPMVPIQAPYLNNIHS